MTWEFSWQRMFEGFLLGFGAQIGKSRSDPLSRQGRMIAVRLFLGPWYLSLICTQKEEL